MVHFVSVPPEFAVGRLVDRSPLLHIRLLQLHPARRLQARFPLRKRLLTRRRDANRCARSGPNHPGQRPKFSKPAGNWRLQARIAPATRRTWTRIGTGPETSLPRRWPGCRMRRTARNASPLRKSSVRNWRKPTRRRRWPWPKIAWAAAPTTWRKIFWTTSRNSGPGRTSRPPAPGRWPEPAGEQRDRLLQRIAFVEAKTDPAEAGRLVSEQMSPGQIQNEAAISVLYQWARQDAAAAQAWAESFPPGDLRDRAINEVKNVSAVSAVSAQAP